MSEAIVHPCHTRRRVVDFGRIQSSRCPLA
jgi:hypothetical protein